MIWIERGNQKGEKEERVKGTEPMRLYEPGIPCDGGKNAFKDRDA